MVTTTPYISVLAAWWNQTYLSWLNFFFCETVSNFDQIFGMKITYSKKLLSVTRYQITLFEHVTADNSVISIWRDHQFIPKFIEFNAVITTQKRMFNNVYFHQQLANWIIGRINFGADFILTYSCRFILPRNLECGDNLVLAWKLLKRMYTQSQGTWKPQANQETKHNTGRLKGLKSKMTRVLMDIVTWYNKIYTEDRPKSWLIRFVTILWRPYRYFQNQNIHSLCDKRLHPIPARTVVFPCIEY